MDVETEPTADRHEQLDILGDFLPTHDACAVIGELVRRDKKPIDPRTLRRMTREVDGLQHIIVAGHAVTTRQWIREYFLRRSRHPNPRRGGRHAPRAA